jgi:hypothetical protein
VEEFCEVQTCQRGRCSREFGRCIDAPDCRGDDANCLSGNYCSDQDRCRPDLCEENDVECSDGGVCQPKTGTCENAESCESTDECRVGHLCVEGTCRLEETACGDAAGDGGCSANRVCEYDAETLEVECVEPSECQTSFDCDEGRRCGGRDCLPVTACRPDGFEPNNGPGTATNYAEVAYDRPAEATLCQGDVDVYKVDTRELPGFIRRGELMVDVTIARADRGLGELEVELVGTGEEVLDTARTGAADTDGTAEASVELAIPDHGVHRVRVSAADGMSEAGLSYEMVVDTFPSDVVQACEQAETLDLAGRTVGTITEEMPRGYGGRCSSFVNENPEETYRFEIDRPQRLRFRLESPERSGDWTMSLLERCAQRATEIGCSDDHGTQRAETLTATLEPGTYYLVVQPSESTSSVDGEFAVTVGRTETTCGPGGHYCGEEGRANVCRFDGSGFREVACGEGCDPATGRCRRPGGDTCIDAETIGPEGAGTREVDFSQYADQYRVVPGTCEGTARWGDGGADRVYRIQIPRKTEFRAEATFSAGRRGGIYLAEQCPGIDESCLVGDRLHGESRPLSVSYVNNAGRAQTRYLVVQTGPEHPEATAELQMDFEEIVCNVGETRCGPDGDVQQCMRPGTEWDEIRPCALTCEGDECRGETCQTAVQVPDDGRKHEYSFEFDGLSDDYTLEGEACREMRFIGDGADAVFEVEADKHDVITVLRNGGPAATVNVVEECRASRGSVECAGDVRVNGREGRFQYIADTGGTHHVMVDGLGSSDETTDLSIEVGPRACDPATSPPTCRDAQRLEYCRFPGFLKNYTCDGGCSEGSCKNPSGGICEDAIEVPRDGKPHTYTFDLAQATDNYTVPEGACPWDPNWNGNWDGREVVARVDAVAGEVIDVDWEAANTPERLAIVSDCNDLDDSCVSAREVGVDSDLRYVADFSGTFFIIADTRPSSPGGYGTGELTVQVRQPTCHPHTALGCVGADTFEYCNAAGLRETLTCGGQCTPDGCQFSTGEVCADAISLEDGDAVSQRFDGRLAIPVRSASYGNCRFDSANRPIVDDIYRIDLSAGERLSVTYDTGVHAAPTREGILYLTSPPCGKMAGCRTNTDQLGGLSGPVTPALTYTAPTDETVYLVVGLASSYPSVRHDYRIEIDID